MSKQLNIIFELVDALSHYTGVQYNVIFDNVTGIAQFGFYDNRQRWTRVEQGSFDFIQGYVQARVDTESGG